MINRFFLGLFTQKCSDRFVNAKSYGLINEIDAGHVKSVETEAALPQPASMKMTYRPILRTTFRLVSTLATGKSVVRFVLY
jgi:hypothetical protein